MKKHLLALAALAAVSGVAAAQSVTVYGIVDTSVWRTNNAISGTTYTSAKSSTTMESGAWLPSLIGFTGTEDLGGGLKANFKLEGNLGSASGTGGFTDRQTWVGLSGAYGEFRAGNQIDALFLQSFVNNVRLAHSNSAAVIGGLFVGSTVTTQSGATATGQVFSPNTVTYVTPAFNGFKATVQHQIGEVAGANKSNSADALLVNYDGIANLSLSAGTKTTKAVATTSKTSLTQNLVAAVYKMGNVQLNAQRLEYRFKDGAVTNAASTAYNGLGATGDKYTLNEFGLGYTVTPALTAALNYVDVEYKTAAGTKKTTDVTSVSLKYGVSKRTSLWTMASRTAKVKGGSQAAGNFFTPAAPFYETGAAGDSQKSTTGFGVGVTHTF
jgi:predicted porin